MHLNRHQKALVAAYGTGIPVSSDALRSYGFGTTYRLYTHPYGGAFILAAHSNGDMEIHSSWDENEKRRADPFPLLKSYVEHRQVQRSIEDAELAALRHAADLWHQFAHLVWRVPMGWAGLAAAGVLLWSWFTATDSSLIQHLYNDQISTFRWQVAAALSLGMITCAGIVAYAGAFPDHAWRQIRMTFSR